MNGSNTDPRNSIQRSPLLLESLIAVALASNALHSRIRWGLFLLVACAGTSSAQLTDRTLAPNTAQAGIAKSLQDEIGAGRGDSYTPGSSIFIINRDPFRSIRRGRQLFQRKFTREQGQGPNEGDCAGDIKTNDAIGAGLSDSCAMCHGRPRGSAGVGGNVSTRPDSRDAPHLFGLGLGDAGRRNHWRSANYSSAGHQSGGEERPFCDPAITQQGDRLRHDYRHFLGHSGHF